MATLQMFCIRDSAMDLYQRPFYMPSRASAIRAFGDAVKEKDNPMQKHPEHYELVHVGQFHEETAGFDLCPPVQVSRAEDFVEKR